MNARNFLTPFDLRAMSSSMNPRVAVLVASLFAGLSLAGMADAAPRLTEKCNTGWATTVYFQVPTGSPLLSTITGVVTNPASDPALYERLWQPTRVRTSGTFNASTSVSLDYSVSQDLPEILASVQKDPLLQSPDVKYLGLDGPLICFSAGPPLSFIPLTEFHNAYSDHYVLAVGPGEAAYVEQGHWAVGWMRTGETLMAPIAASACYGTRHIQRFASLRDQWPPSLFYTVQPDVCGYLRNHNAGWKYVESAFGATAPENGVCTAANSTPVYQLFNNHPDVNRANHRYTSKLSIYNSMQAQGWVGEGIAFCI